ncbi:MAG: hypothetical protein ACLR8P_09390 [Clostridium fessum]
MQYDFDTPIDRTHTWSIKHDFKKENGKADDIRRSGWRIWIFDRRTAWLKR